MTRAPARTTGYPPDPQEPRPQAQRTVEPRRLAPPATSVEAIPKASPTAPSHQAAHSPVSAADPPPLRADGVPALTSPHPRHCEDGRKMAFTPPRTRFSTLPAKQGLYDPADEKDA